MSNTRIDVHTHLIPPFWAEELKTHGGDPSGWGAPEWSPEQLLRFMDEEGIAVSVLSLTAPGVEGWKGDDRIKMTRRVNDYGANLIVQNAKRFGYLATLPLPNIQASLSEIKRAYDELDVDGVTLHSNYDDIYLSDPRLDPIWEELEGRSATIFLHPTRPPMPVLPGAPSPLADYPADTTRCAVDLVLKGHRKRFASTKVILSHGGGYLPFAATRFAELGASLSKDRNAEDFMTDIRSFYYDTALVSPSGLPSLLGTIPCEHIVFGTDYPYASEKVSKIFTANLDQSAEVDADSLEAINRNAASLIQRLRLSA
ncbi:aminocarboxymuconate-semialdehyde decarboxylase [Silvibacterium bohemicum]|uniref:6-methylsalicylate decarboxylase n=1 Tax=Silvibacterium bohemicum TaxID=1577686 RepID=A0A841JTJ4_9BACT|nr:amidohydrolase family protein [Silvibacterium bohemicum]MBB6143807.1 aminocarboxymuconate-semialdehyde decarboxylase [Silvibacterium bohemicum]